MSFRFEKLYADLVSPDGTLCVAYVAWLDLWGARSLHAGLDVFWPDGRREVVRAQSRTQGADWDATDIELAFDVPGGPFVVRYNVTHGAWKPHGDPPSDDLCWWMNAARAEAAGRWTRDPRQPELRETGYADWVELRRPSRRVGLGSIGWGWGHLPGETAAFDSVHFRPGRSWRRGGSNDAGVACGQPRPKETQMGVHPRAAPRPGRGSGREASLVR